MLLLAACGGSETKDVEQTAAPSAGQTAVLTDLMIAAAPCGLADDLAESMMLPGGRRPRVVLQDMQSIEVAGSEREAVLAGKGLSWCHPLEGKLTSLKASFACLRGECLARVVLATPAGPRVLHRQKVLPDEGWVDAVVELPPNLAPGTLTFECTSFGWMAWSDLVAEQQI